MSYMLWKSCEYKKGIVFRFILWHNLSRVIAMLLNVPILWICFECSGKWQTTYAMLLSHKIVLPETNHQNDMESIFVLSLSMVLVIENETEQLN